MSYFCFESVGFVKPLEDWWLILTVDPEIVRYYCWLAKSWGIEIERGSRHGPHISIVAGEKPKSKLKKKWFKLKGRSVKFEYSNQLKHDYYHCWLEVKSRELEKIRQSMGLKPRPFHPFHLTVGRLKLYRNHPAHEPRPKNIKKKQRKPNLESKY